MRSSVLLASSLAVGAMAGPLHKRVMETQINVVETVTIEVTVTAGQPAETPGPAYGDKHNNNYHQGDKHRQSSTCTTDSSIVAPVPSYGPAPVPTSSTSLYLPISSSTKTPPQPTNEPEPEPTYEPEPEPQPEPTSQPPPPSSSAAPQPTGTPDFGVVHKSGEIQATFKSGPDYQNAILWHHNRARANHGASNLEWSDECAAGAQKNAETCKFDHVIVVDGQGQNLFANGGDATNITAGITESFYKAEVPLYPGYGTEPDMSIFSKWGHYTQMVWKETTHVGCYTINCPNMDTNLYTVCNYSPPGNMRGSYAKNVEAPTGDFQSYNWHD